jgi:formate hydrogenlyase subunit 3/multisubunit Na+/H+ antiporter MnhD subunit
VTLLVIALALVTGGGAAALLFSRWARFASACAVAGIVLGGAAGELSAFHVLLGGGGSTMTLGWSIPYGKFHVAIDPLSAFFLVPIFGLSVLAAIYGREYLRPYGATKTWFAFNLLVASMAVVVVARHVVLFLIAWEVMSLCAYLLITFEHERDEVRRAGWIYWIATHLATAVLTAMFLLLSRQTHSFDFDVIARDRLANAALTTLLFALSVAGFGVKIGLVPFHVWLPEAHAAAPSHVSALMSGVLIKMGIYGLLRMLLLLGRPASWWGPLLMSVGLTGALLGISLALYQRDMKRVLAYSSIENMGLITLGVGTGLWGLTSGRPHVAVLGMSGALLHVWNHTLMKGLMFLGAGSILHRCHTKDLEQLGGVMKRMPRTATTMVIGAVAIAGLPPLNGFVGEWLLYLGLIHGALASGGAAGALVLMSVGLVALVGGLAMLCFVRLVGIALLGEPRSQAAHDARESPASMTGPLILLATSCVGVAFFPRAPMIASARVVAQVLGTGGGPLSVDAPLADIGLVNAVLWAMILVGAVSWRAVIRARSVTTDTTWGCGYPSPSPRMQYTSSSFAESMSEALLPKWLRARVSVVAPATFFPQAGSLASERTDPLTRGVYEPFLTRWGSRFARLRWLQQGLLHVYLVYILVAALLALAWTSLRTWSGR